MAHYDVFVVVDGARVVNHTDTARVLLADHR